MSPWQSFAEGFRDAFAELVGDWRFDNLGYVAGCVVQGLLLVGGGLWALHTAIRWIGPR